jgi:hypothetical protein
VGKSAKILLLFAGLTLVWIAVGRPIAQDQGYHNFANQRTVLGIPNAANVLSNLPFIVVGFFGLTGMGRQDGAWRTLWLGLLLTGFGSGFYHWHPSDSTLVWDRLPMAVTFAGVICVFLRRGLEARSTLLPVWLVYAVGTVVYWAWSGDLRAYIVLQFGGMVLLAGIWIVKRERLPKWGWVLLGYARAKVLEGADRKIWSATGGLLAGHAWKHIAAAAGFVPLLLEERRSNPRKNDETGNTDASALPTPENLPR